MVLVELIDGVESAIETPPPIDDTDGEQVDTFVVIPLNMGLAVNDGGNCTVGNDGTGKTSGAEPAKLLFVPGVVVVEVRHNDEDVMPPMAAPAPAKLGKTLAKDVVKMFVLGVDKVVDFTSSSVELLVAFAKT